MTNSPTTISRGNHSVYKTPRRAFQVQRVRYLLRPRRERDYAVRKQTLNWSFAFSLTAQMEIELEVHQIDAEDVLKSMVRIDREVISKFGLKMHGLCEVRMSELSEKRIHVQARTIEKKHWEDRECRDRNDGEFKLPHERWILMDEELRNRLKVTTGTPHRFAFRPILWHDFPGWLRYLNDHEDLATRAAFLVGVFVGVFLLIVGIVVGFFLK